MRCKKSLLNIETKQNLEVARHRIWKINICKKDIFEQNRCSVSNRTTVRIVRETYII